MPPMKFRDVAVDMVETENPEGSSLQVYLLLCLEVQAIPSAVQKKEAALLFLAAQREAMFRTYPTPSIHI